MPICNLWGQCCSNKILMFWWNPHCRIKINPKPNPIYSTSSSFSSLLVQLLCLFLNDHFPLFLFNFCVCFWMIEWVSIFPTWDMIVTNTRVTRILCLCSSIVVWLLTFSLKKEAKMTRRRIPRKKVYERLKPWSYFFGLIGFIHNLIGPPNK
jgi:hypothetical protein